MNVGWRSLPLQFSLGTSPLVALTAASARDDLRVFVLTRDGLLRGVELETGQVFFSHQLGFVPSEGPVTVVASDDGAWVAAAQTFGLSGAVFDVARQQRLRELIREDYHANVSAWTLAFVRHAGQPVLVTSAQWNRLDALALPSLTPLVVSGETGLDYFFGAASVSPSGRWLSSSGWVWHPLGVVRLIDVAAWLEGKPRDPPEREGLRFTAEWWDDDVCWLSDDRVALRGQPQDSLEEATLYFQHSEGVVIADLAAQRVERFIACDAQALATDGRWLFSHGRRVQVFDPQTGALVAAREGPVEAWLPGPRVFIGFEEGRAHAHWLVGTHHGAVPLPAIAPSPAALAVLGDALEAAGAAGELVAHCRAGEPHGARCWVIEALTPAGLTPRRE